MPLRLSAPLIKDFILVETDKKYGTGDESTKVTIKQASQVDNERRSQVLAKTVRIIDNQTDVNRFKLQSEWSMAELMRIEARLTMVGCNIEDEEGKPLFRFKTDNGLPVLDMNDREFERAWGKLPGEVAQEIYSKVLEVNFDWENPLAE